MYGGPSPTTPLPSRPREGRCGWGWSRTLRRILTPRRNIHPLRRLPRSCSSAACFGRFSLYNGQPTQDGGAELRPDLASDLPSVSDDGLIWTFDLKDGIRYAPPFQHTEIVAGDFVRALRRAANPIASSAGTYSFYYGVIAGFKDYAGLC